MLSPYSIITSDCDRNFSFQTSLGDVYFVYFTEFCLTKRNGQVLMVISFGFSCTEKSLKTTYDPRIKSTICFILKSFLERNKDEAIVYLCLTMMGKLNIDTVYLINGLLHSITYMTNTKSY